MSTIFLLSPPVHSLALRVVITATPTTGISVPAPMVDPTGANQALVNIAMWGAGLVTGFLMLAFVYYGLQYMWTHDLSRSTQLKIAAAGILGGAMIVLLAITLAPEFVKLILNQ